MIRTTMTMLTAGVLMFSGISAMAATKTARHEHKAAVVAQADTTATAPAGDATKPAKKVKSVKKPKVSKAKGATADGTTAMPAPAPAPEKEPAKK